MIYEHQINQTNTQYQFRCLYYRWICFGFGLWIYPLPGSPSLLSVPLIVMRPNLETCTSYHLNNKQKLDKFIHLATDQNNTLFLSVSFEPTYIIDFAIVIYMLALSAVFIALIKCIFFIAAVAIVDSAINKILQTCRPKLRFSHSRWCIVCMCES